MDKKTLLEEMNIAKECSKRAFENTTLGKRTFDDMTLEKELDKQSKRKIALLNWKWDEVIDITEMKVKNQEQAIIKLPEIGVDIIMTHILSRLSAKFVGRAKKVCKEWLSSISTKEFARTHCQHMCKTFRQKIITIDLHSCSIQEISKDCEKTIITLPFKVPPSDVWILSSLDGLLCICLRNTYEMVIWNPLIRAHLNLSKSNSYGTYNIYSDAGSLYVDSSKDYSLLHIKRTKLAMEVRIYSIRVGEWRTIPFLQDRHYHTNGYVWSVGTFCGDGVYFTVFQYWVGGDNIIIRFDVNTEKFTEIRFPYLPNSEICQGNLVNIKDEIHMFLTYGFLFNVIELWRYDGERWTIVTSFPKIKYMPLPMWSSITHFNIHSKCLVMTDWGDVYEIDMKTKTCHFFNPSNWVRGLKTAAYVETIVPPSLP